MNRWGGKSFAFAGILLVAWAASVRVQMAIDRQLDPYRDSPEVLWIPSGKVLKKLSLGHEGLMADIYWTRTVQYYGGRIRDRKTDFSLLAPLLDITVTLDPSLLVAYKFGAVFLAEPAPRGPGQPEKAIDLIRRGIQAVPEEWRFWHDLGFIYYWHLRDYREAANAYLEGSRQPQAAPWMKVMAAVIAEKGGNRETSRFLWREIYKSTEDKLIRQNARGHLETLQALEDLEELERRVKLFRDRTGQWPRSFAEMGASGLLAGVPADPRGFPYQIAPDGKVRLHRKSQIDLDRAGALP